MLLQASNVPDSRPEAEMQKHCRWASSSLIKHEGISPISMLFPSASVSNFVKFCMDDGIVPVSLLFSSASVSNLIKFCMDDGIVPVSKLFSRLSVSNLIKFCMDDGIVPVSLLLLKSKVFMLDRFPISIGISMDNELDPNYNFFNSFRFRIEARISPKK